jgi:C4-dicarboxylate transporter DctQ subunit
MFDKLLTLFEEVIITVGLGTATMLLFSNVVARYVFDTGFPWVLETVQYLFAWVVLVGAAHGIKAGVHLGIDLLVNRFSKKNQRRITLLGVALCLGFTVTVLVLSIRYTLKVYEWGDLTLDLQIPQWIPYVAIPVGLTLMSLRFLQVGWGVWQGRIKRIARSEHSQYVPGESPE